MKTVWKILLMSWTVVYALLAWYFLKDGIDSFTITLLVILLLPYAMFILIDLTSADRINPDSFNYEKHGKDVYIYYEEYKIKIVKNDYTKYKVPKYDENNQKIKWLIRERLRNYINNKLYDHLSLPEGIIPIEPKDVKRYFEDMKLCDETDKAMFLNRRHFRLLYVVIFFLILINIKEIVQAIITSTLPPGLFFFIGFLLLILVLNYIGEGKEKKLEQNVQVFFVNCRLTYFFPRL